MAWSPSVCPRQCFPILLGISSFIQLNFTLQWMARQTQEEKIVYRIRNLHFKAFLHGFCGIISYNWGLFCCNLIQGGIFEGLMCWGVFFSLGILHYLNFKDTDAKKRSLADCIFYAILSAWLVGSVVHYGFVYWALNLDIVSIYSNGIT